VSDADVEMLLEQREAAYGSFADLAATSQRIKRAIAGSMHPGMPDTHIEALEMISVKIARILTGDCNHIDSWADIEGYARLVRREIERDEGPEPGTITIL